LLAANIFDYSLDAEFVITYFDKTGNSLAYKTINQKLSPIHFFLLGNNVKDTSLILVDVQMSGLIVS
jgi:hypothetical protein